MYAWKKKQELQLRSSKLSHPSSESFRVIDAIWWSARIGHRLRLRKLREARRKQASEEEKAAEIRELGCFPFGRPSICAPRLCLPEAFVSQTARPATLPFVSSIGLLSRRTNQCCFSFFLFALTFVGAAGHHRFLVLLSFRSGKHCASMQAPDRQGAKTKSEHKRKERAFG